MSHIDLIRISCLFNAFKHSSSCVCVTERSKASACNSKDCLFESRCKLIFILIFSLAFNSSHFCKAYANGISMIFIMSNRRIEIDIIVLKVMADGMSAY